MEIKIIYDYILYLIRQCNLCVSLHPMADEAVITDSFLMNFNFHNTAYCPYIKSLPGGPLNCLSQQKKVYNRCVNERKSFCGVCYAGVQEYVYPWSDGKEIIGFISVSGYQCSDQASHIASVAKLLHSSSDSLALSYSKLKTTMPQKEYVDTLVHPLCKMLELAYMKQDKNAIKHALGDEICRYIQRNYSMDLTEDFLCKEFSCSKSYLSHTFKKHTGKHFREYLSNIRLHHAKQLLENTQLNITQISFCVGFNNSNYFSNVFKKQFGASPVTYRSIHTAK